MKLFLKKYISFQRIVIRLRFVVQFNSLKCLLGMVVGILDESGKSKVICRNASFRLRHPQPAEWALCCFISRSPAPLSHDVFLLKTLLHFYLSANFLPVLFLNVTCLPGMCLTIFVQCKLKHAFCTLCLLSCFLFSFFLFFVGHMQCDPVVFHPLVALTQGMLVISNIKFKNDHSFN